MYDDLPAIGDADGDGDLDIFNFRFSGTGTIEFHQNRSMDDFTVHATHWTSCASHPKWAGITECNCGEFAFNNEACLDWWPCKTCRWKKAFNCLMEMPMGNST